MENHALESLQSIMIRCCKRRSIPVLFLPLGASVLPAAIILGAYIHADKYDLLRLKNNTNVPYISDIGAYKPHSSVFTFGLNLGVMFGFWLILVRHIQVSIVFRNRHSKANRIASCFGFFGIFGELTVGAFQLSSHFTIHYLSAFCFFVSIMIYMFIQTFITFRNLPKKGKKKYAALLVLPIRAVLSLLLLVSVVLFGTFLHPSLSTYNRKGYSLAQSFEWVMFICVIAFMMTFLYDFNDLAFIIDVRTVEIVVDQGTQESDAKTENAVLYKRIQESVDAKAQGTVIEERAQESVDIKTQGTMIEERAQESFNSKTQGAAVEERAQVSVDTKTQRAEFKGNKFYKYSSYV